MQSCFSVSINASEGMNTVLQWFKETKELYLDEFILNMHILQNYYTSEFERGKTSVGEYSLVSSTPTIGINRI